MNQTQRVRAALNGALASLRALTEDSSPVLPSTSAAVQPPGAGALASLGRTTGWFNSPPLTAAGLGSVVVVTSGPTPASTGSAPALPVRLGAALPPPGSGGPGRAHARVRLRARPRQRPPGRQGPRVDYPVTVDNDSPSGPPSTTTTAGPVPRRRPGPGSPPPRRRRRLPAVRDDPAATAPEAGADGIDPNPVTVQPAGVEAAADWDSLWSPENYLGYERSENFASPNGGVGDPHGYAVPGRLRLNHWALGGDWTVGRHAVVLHQAAGGSPTASTPAT